MTGSIILPFWQTYASFFAWQGYASTFDELNNIIRLILTENKSVGFGNCCKFFLFSVFYLKISISIEMSNIVRICFKENVVNRRINFV